MVKLIEAWKLMVVLVAQGTLSLSLMDGLYTDRNSKSQARPRAVVTLTEYIH